VGFLTTALQPNNQRGLELTDAAGWQAIGWLGDSATGINVTQEGALRYSAVFACVRVLAESVASLPLIVYRRTADGKERAPEHPLYRLLHDRPNDYMTSFELRETLQGHLALWGNAYCEIEYNNAGVPIALWPLRPDRMEKVTASGGELFYEYWLPSGSLVKLPGYRVWHNRGLSSDGINGYSPIGLMRQSVALGLAAEEFGARFFGNDARPGGVLQHPGVLGDKALLNLRESWQSRHGGLSRSHRTAILEEGMTYQQIGIPPEDAQFLETRKFQVTEIARMFRVPPHMLADLERATFSNIEHQSIEFVMHTLRPWLVRWEQSIQMRLMPAKDQGSHYAEFLVDGLLRGDVQSRYQAYAVGRQNGWLSANDIRRLENQNPIDDGDVYLIPLNMVPASAASAPPPAPETPPPAARSEQRMVTMANGAEVRAEQWDAAQARHRLQITYLPLYEDVAGRIIRREANDIGNQARKILGKGTPADFREWLEEFYVDHTDFVYRQYEPVSKSYTAQIIDLAAREVGSDAPILTNFLEAYLSSLAGRHVVRNKSRLLDLLQAADDDAQEQIVAELDHWRETKPARIARDESVRASNAVALAAYGALGRSHKILITFGDNCAYCNALAGNRFNLEIPFLSEGQSFMPEGASAPLVAGGHISHAPIHEGCDCMVVTI
jgi:HK97 family phage portal protein